MKTTLKTIAAILLIPFLLASPAYAETPESEPEIRGFQDTNGTIIIASEMDMGDPELAEMVISSMDTETLEDSFDILIVQEDAMTGDSLLGLGADDATMYGFVGMETAEPGLLIIASSGPNVYIMLTMGDLDDVEPFAQFSMDVLLDGLEDADEPDGYTEVELEDEEVLPADL
jgi:hypothetical protein